MNWIFLVVPLAIVTRLIFSFYKESQRINLLQREGIRAQGVVLKNTFFLGRISVTRPVIQFTTQAEEIVEAVDMKGTAMAFPKYSKGETVTLLYQKENPRNFTITSAGRYF